MGVRAQWTKAAHFLHTNARKRNESKQQRVLYPICFSRHPLPACSLPISVVVLGHNASFILSTTVPTLTSRMPKLKFKRTPEEEAEHQARKAARKERKRKREHYRTPSPMPSSGKRAHKESKWDADEPQRKWASSDEEDRAGPSTRSDKRRSDASDDAMRAQMEDELFREKMFGAMGEDERLDGLESHLNSYVHIPDRWKSAAMGSSGKALYDADEFLRLDPSTLDDDEYAEWIRLGMYRSVLSACGSAMVMLMKVSQENSRRRERCKGAEEGGR